MILPWIRAGFECCDGIRILYMEKNLLYESMVSCDVFDSGTGSKKMEPEEWGVVEGLDVRRVQIRPKLVKDING